MADQYGAQLEPVDWSSTAREDFQRAFLDLPAVEASGVEDRRSALGVRIEDLGGLAAAPAPLESFEELDALPAYALEGLQAHGIVAPMPIQAQALPLVLAGCDLIGLAQTGSGKTLAFLLPAVAHIEAQPPLAWRAATPIALILAPTRELAVQISEEAAKVLKGSRSGRHRSGVWAACLYGGGRKGDQVRSLSWGSHIVVATPGRLIDFAASGVISFERTTYFVLDEADRMLDMGFQGDVASVSSQIRPERQVLFFSATWSSQVQELASGLCHKGSRPVRISVGQSKGLDGEGGAEPGDKAARLAREGIVQEVVVVDFPDDYERQVEEKRRLLDEHIVSVLSASEENKVLVFVSSKTYADELATKLWDAGFKAAAMHGGKSQESRLWTLDQFRKGDLRLLVATDVIGRGIDIPSVSHVVVFEMGSIDDYVHRIGRTARGKDAKGHALVFFEYYYKEPGIAEQLAEVLAASKQPVPEGLRRIAKEVHLGQREVFDPYAGKWGSKWKSNGGGGGGGWNGGQSGWNSSSRGGDDGGREGGDGYRRVCGRAGGGAPNANDRWGASSDAVGARHGRNGRGGYAQGTQEGAAANGSWQGDRRGREAKKPDAAGTSAKLPPATAKEPPPDSWEDEL